MGRRSQASKEKPTGLFKSYAAQLLFRLALLAYAVYLFATQPEKLSISAQFGFVGGFNFVDLVFASIMLDFVTKFFPNANISMGSLKQYGEFHVPTIAMFKEGRKGALAWVGDMISQGRVAAEKVPEQLRVAWNETRTGALDSLKVLLKSVEFMRILPFREEQLTASESARNQIRADRYREIMPVIVFWPVWNIIIGAVLGWTGWLSEATVMIWMLFYFAFDMICVVLWCPIQLVLMKNRCCTTCQIFNWDAIMTATPLLALLLVPSTFWFVWPLLIIALVVLVRWELAFARHPERFDERTNASLSCHNCKDKLCYVREPLAARLSDIQDLPAFAGKDRTDSCSEQK